MQEALATLVPMVPLELALLAPGVQQQMLRCSLLLVPAQAQPLLAPHLQLAQNGVTPAEGGAQQGQA